MAGKMVHMEVHLARVGSFQSFESPALKGFQAAMYTEVQAPVTLATLSTSCIATIFMSDFHELMIEEFQESNLLVNLDGHRASRRRWALSFKLQVADLVMHS